MAPCLNQGVVTEPDMSASCPLATMGMASAPQRLATQAAVRKASRARRLAGDGDAEAFAQADAEHAIR